MWIKRRKDLVEGLTGCPFDNSNGLLRRKGFDVIQHFFEFAGVGVCEQIEAHRQLLADLDERGSELLKSLPQMPCPALLSVAAADPVPEDFCREQEKTPDPDKEATGRPRYTGLEN